MEKSADFDLKDFLPYLLNLAAEEASLEFQVHYKQRYGMLRTEWRVLFHLGRYGEMTAREICDRSRMHKTKISRAIAKLEKRRFIKRSEVESDRRHSMVMITQRGLSAFTDLVDVAQDFDKRLVAEFSDKEEKILRSALAKLAKLK